LRSASLRLKDYNVRESHSCRQPKEAKEKPILGKPEIQEAAIFCHDRAMPWWAMDYLPQAFNNKST
jgi:hypothetical protein